MHQKLPGSAGYPLVVSDISRTVYPGEEFDAPGLVPGCVSLEPPGGTGAGGVRGDDGTHDGEHAPPAPARAAASKKEQRP